jgi:predicted RNA-binding Zn ribbon-like protein
VKNAGATIESVSAARAAPPSQPQLPFKYLGGNVSLDLVNTVDWTRRGLANERLSDCQTLIRWVEGAGLVSGRDAERLRSRARSHPGTARAALDETKRLRALLARLYRSLLDGKPRRAVWKDFNRNLTRALRSLRVAPLPPERNRFNLAEWAWSDQGTRLNALLWPVLWSAAGLLVSDEVAEVCVCAGRDCGWMYVDRSRNGLRRWCAMATCGTAEKSRRRRLRNRRRGARGSRPASGQSR